MAPLQSFRDLNVYPTARREAKRILEVTQAFPRGEMYALTDQVSHVHVNAERWRRDDHDP